jgi:hypothetical protein
MIRAIRARRNSTSGQFEGSQRPVDTRPRSSG